MTSSGFFYPVQDFPTIIIFLDTVHGQISRYTLPSSQSGFFPFLPLRPPGILATASHPATGLDYESPHIVGFFSFFTTNHTNRNAPTRRGSPWRPLPWSQISVNPQSTDWGWFLKTYPRVRILPYSPRTGTRTKCPHRSRLQDAVGFFFFTTTNKQIPTGTFKTQWVFSFLPRQTNKYPRVLHTRVYFFLPPQHKGFTLSQPKKTGSISQKSTHLVRKWHQPIGK